MIEEGYFPRGQFVLQGSEQPNVAIESDSAQG